MDNLIFGPLLIVVVTANVLWYMVKAILKENDYKVHYWYGHFKDIPNFKNLIYKTENAARKSKYLKLYWALISSIILFVGLASFAFINHF